MFLLPPKQLRLTVALLTSLGLYEAQAQTEVLEHEREAAAAAREQNEAASAQAQARKVEAEEARQRSEQLAAVARAQREADEQRQAQAIALKREADEARLKAVAERQEAEQAQKTAEQQQQLAEQARLTAVAQQREAEQAKKQAEAEKIKAEEARNNAQAQLTVVTPVRSSPAVVAGAPIQAGESFAIAIRGNEFGCSMSADNGSFSEAGLLFVQDIAPMGNGFVLNAKVRVFHADEEGVTVLSLMSVPISADGNFNAVGQTFADIGIPNPSSGNFNASGRLTSAGLRASGVFREVYPETCRGGTFAMRGRGQGGAGPLSASSDVLTATEQQRTNVGTARTVARVAQSRLGLRRGGGAQRPPGNQKSSFNLTPADGGWRAEAKTGLSAGEYTSGPIASWVSASYGDSSDDSANSGFDSTRWSILAGVDVSSTEDWVVGVALGLDRSDIDTQFNGGGAEITGWTIAPYAGAVIAQSLNFDISAGFSYTEIDQFRTLPVALTRITARTNGHRWFVNGNASYDRTFGNWTAIATAGLLYASNRTERFTASNGTTVSSAAAKLGQLRAGGELVYSFGAWETFGRGIFEFDYATSGAGLDVDEHGGQLSFGLRYFSDGGLSAGMEYATVIGRKNFSDDSVSATMRWGW